MKRYVESLKRLYKGGKVTALKLDALLLNNDITQDEYNYIVD